jgi:hypothetical protein
MLATSQMILDLLSDCPNINHPLLRKINPGTIIVYQESTSGLVLKKPTSQVGIFGKLYIELEEMFWGSLFPRAGLQVLERMLHWRKSLTAQ